MVKGRARGVRYIPVALLLLAFVLAGCFGPSTPTPTTGTLVVTSEPAGAQVFLDDEDTGKTTNAELKDVAAGNRKVTVVLDGYESQTKQVAVTAGKTGSVDFDLVPIDVSPASASIVGTVTGLNGPLTGATVMVFDGEGEVAGATRTGEGGEYRVSVLAGTYEISVSAKYYFDESEFVTVGPGEEQDVSFDLDHIGMAEVSGYVSENRGGRRLSGVTVTAYEVDTGGAVASATTDGSGFYFLEIPIGTYDIVTDKEGQAQGKRQGLTLDIGDQATANLMAKPLRDPSIASAVAPDLIVLLEDEFGDFVPFEAGVVVDPSVTTEGLVEVLSDFDVYRIKVWVGHEDDEPDFETGILRDELFFALGDLLPPFGFLFDLVGETELIVAAYDYHNNWTEVRIPFVYEVGEPSVEVGPIDGLDLIAFTYGHDLGLYLKEREQLFASFGIAEDPTLFDLGDGTMLDLSRLDKDVTMYTVLRWAESFYEEDGELYLAEGYEIERSFHRNGPWKRIARVGYFFGQPYVDTSPELEAGKPVYYRVRAVGPNGETGPWSVPLSVTPLDRFEINLVGPADDATDVSLTPTLRWEHTEIGADEYMFDVYVAAVTGDPDGISGYYMWYFEDAVDITEVDYNDDGSGTELLPAHTYMWNVVDGRAFAYYRDNSMAVAFPGTGLAANDGYAGAANGAFLFTTTHEQ